MKERGELNARFHIRTEMRVEPSPGREGQIVTAQLPIPMEYAQVKNVQI